MKFYILVGALFGTNAIHLNKADNSPFFYNEKQEKLKPYATFKGVVSNGTRECCRNTIACELQNRLQDNYGNSYPPKEKIHLTCNETGNLNGVFTKDVLEKVTFLFMKVQEDNRGHAE